MTLFLFVQTTSAFNPFCVDIEKIIRNIVQLDRNNPKAGRGVFQNDKLSLDNDTYD